MSKDKILNRLNEQQDDYLKMIKEFVQLESPSYENKEASDKCSKFLENAFRNLGFNIELIPQNNCGDHVYGEIGKGDGIALIIGHYDTVYPLNTIESMPFTIQDGKAYGPGILDMKSGILMAYFALKTLLEFNLMPVGKIGVFFNSDEETGSFYSSDLIVEKAHNYKNVLVMEPALKDINTVKTHRYGRGTYDIIAHGKAAHSGTNPHLAISPLMEIARQLLQIEQLDKDLDGVTLAPTAIRGGVLGTCMVPETAYLTMDVRYKSESLAKTVHERILNLSPLTKDIRLEVKGKIDKPVMIADESLYEKLQNIALGYGIKTKGVTVGGGSDGNFTSAAGIPTLDGLGATGEFLHNPEEYINIDHIALRTAMFAKLIQRL